MRTTRHYDPRIATRKFTSSLSEMSKRKSVENPKDEKKGKITVFFIPKERTEKGKFI